MGYYTDYDFSNNIPEVISEIEKQSGYDQSENGFYYQVKWYDHEKDLKNVSLLFQDVPIILEGDGEETGDLWRKYFMNGKMQKAHAEVSFASFDYGQLR